MAIALIHTLIYLALVCSRPDQDTLLSRLSKVKEQLTTASVRQWDDAIATLNLHGLSPLVSYALHQYDLLTCIPEGYRNFFQVSYRETLTLNTLRLLTLDGLLQQMATRQVVPVLWKGVVLAERFYPDLGTRPMGDMDFAIAAEAMPQATAAFNALGFTLLPEKTTPDAVYFTNRMGLLCDVHHRVRLFEHQDSPALYENCPPYRMKSAVRILSPNAMVTHLIVHLDGHWPETGPLLMWMVDLALVLRQWGDRLDPEHIQALLPDRRHWLSLLRILRFLEVEWGEVPPACLQNEVRQVVPLTLASVLRQRRLALWELPRPRGWLKLCATRLGLVPSRDRTYPHWSDLLLWTGDSVSRMVL